MKRYFVFSVIVLGILGSLLLAAKAKGKKDIQNPDVKAAVAGNSKFAFELYAKLKDDPRVKKDGGNLFFSPYSISTALAMTYAGARGRTEKQMADVLHFSLPQERLHPAFGALEKQLNTGGKKGGYQLSVANALWGQKGYAFLKDFLDLTRKNYGAGLKEVDFVRETEKTRKTINAWVEKKTKDKIKELIQKGVVDNATLVLTNAIYFKGDWASKFKEENTHDAGFDLGGPKTMIQIIPVPMMQQKGKFKYAERDKLQILELPYKDKELSMIILLPKKGPYLALDALKELEKSLTLKNLEKWLAELREQEVMVYLPRFKMTWGVFELKDILKAMGMTAAFSGADFSGMTGHRNLFISNVLHKAFVEVNEEGTEAAAATAVVMREAAMAIPVFRADHPFVFMIKDNRSGSILFMGRVMNPAKQDN